VSESYWESAIAAGRFGESRAGVNVVAELGSIRPILTVLWDGMDRGEKAILILSLEVYFS